MFDAEISALSVETNHFARDAVVQKVVLRRGIVKCSETLEHVPVAVIVIVIVAVVALRIELP